MMISLEKSIKYLLFATVLTPLIYTPSLLFPFVTGKVLFFRLVAGLVFVLFLWLLVRDINWRDKFWQILKQPLVIMVLLFFVSLIISTIFAISPYDAFWSNLERGEGLFTMFHFLAFFLVSATVFSKKDWLHYVKWSLVVGLLIVIFSAVWPSVIFGKTASSLWSTLGNSSYVGGYFLMLFWLGLWLRSSLRTERSEVKQSPEIATVTPSGHSLAMTRIWRYLATIIAIISVLMIFLAASRGAMLAFVVGVFVWLGYKTYKTYKICLCHPERSEAESKELIGKIPRQAWNDREDRDSSLILRMTVGIIIIFALLVSGFWMTREASVWQKIPGLDRLSTISLNHPTAQTRILSWGSSWEAFKEKPVFGWGPENFIVAYNKYYNPKYALYEAAWFDRAHNKVFDVLVMQGLFGILVYLGIFGVAFWSLLKRKNSAILRLQEIASSPLSSNIFLALLLLTYFIQNLFVFDQPTSYLLFFVVLGMITRFKIYDLRFKNDNLKS